MKQLCHRTYKQKSVKKEYSPIKKSKEYQQFYGSRAWHILRSDFIFNHPLCQRCLENGISKPSDCVHHSVPFSWFPDKDEKWKCFLYDKWLIPLCSECHKEIHKTLFKPTNFELTKEYNIIHNN